MARSERRELEGWSFAGANAPGRGGRPRLLGGLGCSVAAVALLFCLSGYARGGRGANGADTERQSESEYDVARDLFLSRHDPRGALGHAQKAVELNDQNADAYHFIALLYLYF